LHTLTVGHGGPLAMDAVRRRSERLLAQLEGLSSSEDKR
jgi:hypothetical protein